MKRRALTIALSLLAMTAIAASAGQQVTLKRIPKVGEKVAYKMKVALAFQGMNIDVSFDVANEVTKVNPDGSYLLVETNTNHLVTMDGQILEEGGEEEKATYTYAPDGSITKIESDNLMGGEQQMANLTAVIWPKEAVGTGSKWKSKIAANKDADMPEITIDYEIVAREKVAGKDCLKIKFDAKGGKSSNVGHTWVEVGTGLTVKSEGQMKAVPIQGMEMDPQYLLELKG
jgi:hypothetical protein